MAISCHAKGGKTHCAASLMIHHFWSLKMLAVMAVAFLLVVWVATAPRSQREATFQAVQAPPRGYSMVRGLVPPLHLCFQPPAHKRRRCCKGGARA